MGKATNREIMQSMSDHERRASDQGQQRQNVRTPVGHTSESPRVPQSMYSRAKADPRDKLWRALGKQVRHGVAVRVNVRG